MRGIGMQVRKWLKKETICRIFVILILLGTLAWSLLAEPTQKLDVQQTYISMTAGWSQVIGEERIELESLDEIQEVSLGESIILETTLRDISIDEIILFYTENQEVSVSVGGEQVYCFEMQEGYEFLGTPGSTWNKVSLTEEMSGQILRIEYTSQFEYYHMTIHTVYRIHDSMVYTVIFDSVGVFCVIAGIILMIGIVSYINGFIWKRAELRRYLLNMGDLYFFTGLWLLTELNFFDIFIQRPIFCYIASMILLRILPLIFWKFVYGTLPRKYVIMNVLGVVGVINIVLTGLLQFSFGISFVDLLLMNNIFIIFAGIVISGVLIYAAIEVRASKKNGYQFLVSGILIIGGMIDVSMFYWFSEYAIVMGVAFSVTFIIYSVIAHIMLLNHETTTDVEKIRIEKEYKKLQSSSLMQQIKAHFIFNTLNTISALCKQNAKAADSAIKLFAKYLRSYMYLINQYEMISFENELSLVKSYLEIEKLRFGKSFTFDLSIEYKEFDIPPLTIQPLVENAMNHGLRKHSSQGYIQVSAERINDEIKIVVSDNGAGFDVSRLNNENSIGIQNVKKRVELMANGTIEFKSELEVGTQVEMRIPVRREGEYEDYLCGR